MSLTNEIFNKAKDHLRAIAGDVVEILTKDNQKIVNKLEEIDVKKTKRHKESEEAEKTQQEAVLRQIKGVESAIKERETVKSVAISNPEAISSDIKEVLLNILQYVKAEYEKEEKDIELSNDFSSLEKCIMDSSSKGETAEVMSAMMSKLEDLRAQDTTEMFASVVEAINNKQSPELYGVLCDIRDKQEQANIPSIMNVDLDPNLIEDNRIRVVLRDDQVSRIVGGGGEKSVYVMTADGGRVSATAAGNLKVSVEEFNSDLTTINADRTTNLDGKIAINTNAMMFGRVSDTVVKNARIDSSTETIMMVEYAHHEIHDGTSYTTNHTADISNGFNMDILLVTPDTTTYGHMTYEIESELEMDFSLYEDTTTSNNGTTLNIYNRNRNSASTATLTASHTPTVTSVGTKIRTWHTGSKKDFGGGDRATHEIILKRNTKYLFRLTNSSGANNYMSAKIDFYEHADRN